MTDVLDICGERFEEYDVRLLCNLEHGHDGWHSYSALLPGSTTQVISRWSPGSLVAGRTLAALRDAQNDCAAALAEVERLRVEYNDLKEVADAAVRCRPFIETLEVRVGASEFMYLLDALDSYAERCHDDARASS